MTAPARAPRPPILALDQATRLGWAFLAAGAERPESGALQLPDSGPCARIVAFESWLWPRLAALGGGRGLVVYEGTVARFASSFRTGCHLEASILKLAAAWGAHVLEIPPAQAKKLATGNGNADKAAVTAAMRARWARPGLEDNDEADALALLGVAVDQLAAGLLVLPGEDAA